MRWSQADAREALGTGPGKWMGLLDVSGQGWAWSDARPWRLVGQTRSKGADKERTTEGKERGEGLEGSVVCRVLGQGLPGWTGAGRLVRG